MVIEKLVCYRGDQNAATLYAFTNEFTADQIEQVRFYVRTDVDRTLLLRLSSVDHPAQWTIEDNVVTCQILGSDTNPLPPGKWIYDVELRLTDGRIVTIWRGRFVLVGDIVTDLLSEALPAGLYGLTDAQKCALDNAPQASCENPFITVNDMYANISGLHTVTQFRATYQSETGVIGGVPGQAFITDVYVVRIGQWDALTSFQLGTALDPDWLIGNDDHDLLEFISEEDKSPVRRITVNKYVDSPMELVATWDQGGATEGEALIIVDWRSIHFRSIYAEIQWEATTEIIGTVPGHSIITGIYVVRQEAWSWGYNSSFKVGKSDVADWLVGDSEHQLSEAVPDGESAGVVHITSNQRYVADPTAIVITQTTESVYPLTGYGFVVVTYEPLPGTSAMNLGMPASDTAIETAALEDLITDHEAEADPHTQYVEKAGDTMTGALELQDGLHVSNGDIVADGDVVVAGTVKVNGEIDMGGQPLVNVPTPTATNDAVNKTYVDNAIGGVSAAVGAVAGDLGDHEAEIGTAVHGLGTASVEDVSEFPTGGTVPVRHPTNGSQQTRSLIVISNSTDSEIARIDETDGVHKFAGVDAEVNRASQRTELGLGTAAVEDATAFDAAGSAATVQGNLDTHTGLTGTAVHGLGTAAVEDATAFDAAGSAATVQGNLDTHTGLTGTAVHGLGTAAVEDATAFDAAGSAAAVQGNLDTHTGSTANPHSVTAAQAGAVAKAGDTMTGPLILSGDAVDALGAVTKQQLEAAGGAEPVLEQDPLQLTAARNRLATGSTPNTLGVGAVDLQGTRTASTQVASGDYSFASGRKNTASNTYAHAEGNGTTASGSSSHAEGGGTTASGSSSHAEGTASQATGLASHAEGQGTLASGASAHSEGSFTTASGQFSHAEGATTTASGVSSHAEGSSTTASGDRSHAGGNRAKATHDGAYVRADDSNFDFNSVIANEYAVRATGGVRLVTAIDGAGVATKTTTLTPAGIWTYTGATERAAQRTELGLGTIATEDAGWSGSFTNGDGNTVTVVNGLITAVTTP